MSAKARHTFLSNLTQHIPRCSCVLSILFKFRAIMKEVCPLFTNHPSKMSPPYNQLHGFLSNMTHQIHVQCSCALSILFNFLAILREVCPLYTKVLSYQHIHVQSLAGLLYRTGSCLSKINLLIGMQRSSLHHETKLLYFH